MSIGDKWAVHGMGSMDKESSFELLDTYFDMGGYFFDTANTYQGQSSKEFIGEWAEKRGIRDQLIITKYSTNYQHGNDSIVKKVNYIGDTIKSMHLSVGASLKRLQTWYIDILYLRWWDYETSIPEVMDSLHNLVVAQKVLYLGISDTPALVISQANQYAMDHGKMPFIVYQGKWSIQNCSFECDIIPMARSLGMALALWGVLRQGKLHMDTEEEHWKETGEKGHLVWGPNWECTEVEAKAPFLAICLKPASGNQSGIHPTRIDLQLPCRC